MNRRHRQPRKFFDPRYVPVERRKSYILACVFFWSILSFLFISRFVLASVEVVGSSMIPTLHDGERRIMHRWPTYLREPHRGDLVALELPRHGELSVKRIVGMPGDVLWLQDGRVYVNRQLLHEPYLATTTATHPGRFGGEPVTLGPGDYFVLGDNRADSEDSRAFGPVNRAVISGLLRP